MSEKQAYPPPQYTPAPANQANYVPPPNNNIAGRRMLGNSPQSMQW